MSRRPQCLPLSTIGQRLNSNRKERQGRHEWQKQALALSTCCHSMVKLPFSCKSELKVNPFVCHDDGFPATVLTCLLFCWPLGLCPANSEGKEFFAHLALSCNSGHGLLSRQTNAETGTRSTSESPTLSGTRPPRALSTSSRITKTKVTHCTIWNR